jgi:hypothetical protein
MSTIALRPPPRFSALVVMSHPAYMTLYDGAQQEEQHFSGAVAQANGHEMMKRFPLTPPQTTIQTRPYFTLSAGAASNATSFASRQVLAY